MKPEEFKQLMTKIIEEDGDNNQEAHERMDSVMCECLKSIGYEEGIIIFETQHKWYA